MYPVHMSDTNEKAEETEAFGVYFRELSTAAQTPDILAGLTKI